MTTIDLFQRFAPRKDFTHHGKASFELKAFNDKNPDPTIPNPNPSQYFDAKTKCLHDMLDRVVKDLATSQPEPASEWDGTLWRSPLQPRSRSPAYSEISDSFESPSMIEHCTNDLLSTPMSPTSAQFKGPDGWPLGIEVAMNDFERGRLSTSVLQDGELPNPLILRKHNQQTPRSRNNGFQEWHETASCERVPSEQQGDGQQQQENAGLKLFDFQIQQSNVPLQKCGESQDHLDRAGLEPLASQRQGLTHYQRHSKCQYQQGSVDLDLFQLQQQYDEETNLDAICIPTLSARKYRDDQNSLENASSELHSALVHGKLPIGLGLHDADLGLFTCQHYNDHSEEHDGSHTQINGTCLLNRDSSQTAPSDPPRNKDTHEDRNHAESRINELSDALDEKFYASKASRAFGEPRVESIDRDIGCQNTFEDSENNALQGIEQLKSKDSKANIDSDIVSWKTLGPLEDILEESELISTLTLDRGQPQHFNLGSVEPLDFQELRGTSESRDSMLALQKPQAESTTLSSTPPRVPPTLKLTINPSTKCQFESTKPSTHRPIVTKSFESILSAAALAELSDPNREKGRVSAAVLAEMRKTAKSQAHFQTGPDSPKDESQAEFHPLLRVKSKFRPSSQSSQMVDDSALKYVFKDHDSEGHEAKEEDSFSRQITMKPLPTLQPEARDAKSFVTQRSMEEAPSSSQLGKMMDDTVLSYICSDDDIEGHEADYVGTFTPQRSTLRSSNDTTLVPSLENVTPPSSFLPSTSPSILSHLSSSAVGSPEVMPSFTSQRLVSSSTTGYYPNSAIGSPAAYNSWATSPHCHEHGNFSSTPSSAATLLTSTVPTPNTPFHSSSPVSRGTTMTASLSFGHFTGNLPISRGATLTPSSSFGNFTDNKNRRSVSLSSMFARYQKPRYPDLPTAAMTDSMFSSIESAEKEQAREVTNDPFTSTSDTTKPFYLHLMAPSKEYLADKPTIGVKQFNTPTKHSPGRFGLRRRSLSTSGRPNTNEGIERALTTMIFNPNHSRHRKRINSISGSIDNTAKPDGSCPGHRRSLSIAASSVEQKWEIAPPPTPLGLRDEFSMRYRPEPLEAEDHYFPRKEALKGMKHGLKKVFGRK